VERPKGEIAKIYLSRVDRVAFVRGDDDVDFQYVAEVIDEAKGAGVDHIGLMSKK
jgi:biopolymer transport protein TolR